MLKKLKNLGKSNFKYKIQSLERFFGVKFYSSSNSNNIILKFIYILFFISKSFSIFKKNYVKIFNKNKKGNNFICILPRCGNNLIRCIFSSYYELYYNLGNGIPKYNVKEDKWKFNFELNSSLELFSATLEEKEIFMPDNIFFSQYPISKINLLDITNSKTIIVVRNPQDLLVSWYLHDAKNDNEKNFNNELFEKRIRNLNFAFSYWEKFMENKKNNKDFLLIKFEDLVTDTEMAITSMFKFLNIIFDQELLIKSIELNQKKNHIKYMDNKIDNTIRFSSSTNKELIDLIKIKSKNKIFTTLY